LSGIVIGRRGIKDIVRNHQHWFYACMFIEDYTNEEEISIDYIAIDVLSKLQQENNTGK
jgi:hypothetical protein